MLGGEIFVQVGDGVASGLKGRGAERLAGGGYRIYSHGMVGEIGGKATVFDLLHR